MNVTITFLAGAFGGWCLRVLWVQIRGLRRKATRREVQGGGR